MAQQPPAPDATPLDDYLYVDRERLAGYHTQLLGSGTPLESKLVENYNRSEAKTANAGVPGVVSGTITGTEGDTSGTERRFDLGWLTVLQTIDELSRRGYIKDQVVGLPVGSIFRMHGAMQLVDLRIMRDMWGPMTKAVKNIGGNKKSPTVGFTPAQLAEIIKVIPHPLVFQMVSSTSPYGQPMTFDAELSATAWGILAPQNIIGTADTFSLMNGGLVPGDYAMIGLLDAGNTGSVNVEEMFPPTNMFNMTLSLQQNMRSMFGRPDHANGVTPLLIYRALSNRQ